MTIEDNLRVQLEQADPGDLIDVIVVLENSAVQSRSGPVDPSNIAAGRMLFAKQADELLKSAINDASRKSGQSCEDLTVFARLASARLTAPAKLVKHLATHPLVASIGLASDKAFKKPD